MNLKNKLFSLYVRIYFEYVFPSCVVFAKNNHAGYALGL